jgi:beta-N-acetylhexosaminidase
LNKAVEDNKIFPAVFACDCEPSLFHKKFTDADSLTPASMLRSVSEVRQMALVISEEMKKMGIQWNFAPVADISDNQEIINDRSFGNDDSEVIEKSVAFIQTSESNNIATSVKHFPGHGAVKGDSHKNLVYIDSVFKELNNFSAIFKQANPVSVMAGHIAVRNIPGLNTSGKPATLSEKIIKRLLKDSLNFKGIVVTDAMNMGAVKNIKNADFMAVQAGNDLVLIPNNPRDLHRRIVQLIKEKSKSSEKVIASIKKIIRLKICLGLL